MGLRLHPSLIYCFWLLCATTAEFNICNSDLVASKTKIFTNGLLRKSVSSSPSAYDYKFSFSCLLTL